MNLPLLKHCVFHTFVIIPQTNNQCCACCLLGPFFSHERVSGLWFVGRSGCLLQFGASIIREYLPQSLWSTPACWRNASSVQPVVMSRVFLPLIFWDSAILTLRMVKRKGNKNSSKIDWRVVLFRLGAWLLLTFTYLLSLLFLWKSETTQRHQSSYFLIINTTTTTPNLPPITVNGLVPWRFPLGVQKLFRQAVIFLNGFLS